MNDYQFAFGLDFGTSKTALAFARCGTANPNADDIILDEGMNARIPTCLLIQSGSEEVVAIGNEAETEYLMHVESERQRDYRFVANFKPQIHRSREDKGYAQSFLCKLSQLEPVSTSFERYGDVAMVVVGRPASWPAEAQAALIEIVQAAGFPNPRSMPEPVGAFFFHLVTRLKAEDFSKDVLVVDWGAGTCDFSLMHHGKSLPHKSWGSNVYGGRLFDDLFYQWFIDSARGGPRAHDLAAVESDPVSLRVLQVLRSRELKEEYSRWSSKPKRNFRSSYIEIFGRLLGQLEIASTSEFEERARSYRATKEMKEQIAKLRADADPADWQYVDKLLEGATVDLLAWAVDLFRRGTAKYSAADVDVVILTGGSSCWPWFKALVSKEGTVRESPRIYFDDIRPDLSIARGLCRAYAIGTYASGIARKWDQKKKEVFQTFRETFFDPQMEDLGKNLVDQYLLDCYTAHVEPILSDWKEKRISREEAKQLLSASFGTWFDDRGEATLNEVVEVVEKQAGRALQDAARKNEIDFGGLLGLTMEVYAPLRFADGSLKGIPIGQELVDELAGPIKNELMDAIAKVSRPVLEKLILMLLRCAAFPGEFIRCFLETDDERAARERREKDKAEAISRRVREELRATVAGHINKAVRDALASAPSFQTWASPDGPLYRTVRDTLLEVARSSGTSVDRQPVFADSGS